MVRVPRIGWFLALGGAIAGAAVCGREDVVEPGTEASAVVEPPVIEPPPLRVELTGCAGGEKQANTCVLAEERLISLWTEGLPATVSVDAKVVELRVAEAIDGGWRSVVPIPEGAKTLEVARGETKWTLRLLERPATPILDAIQKSLPKQNDPERTPGAKRALERIERELGTMSAFERADALRLATVLTWDVGRDASGYGRRALDAALGFGDPTLVVRYASIFGYMVEEGGADARWTTDLESLYVENVLNGEERVNHRLDIGFYAIATGETGRGLESLRVAEAMARRLGLRDLERSGLARLAIELATFGLEAEHAAVLQRFVARNAVSRSENACVAASIASNVATSLVYARMLTNRSVDPEPMLRSALAMFETDEFRCEPGENPDWRFAHAFVHANSVLTAVIDERWDDVEAGLRWFAKRKTGMPDLDASIALSRAQLALARGDARRARRLLPRARGGLTLTEWRRAVVSGHVHEAAGDAAAALRAFLEAEAIVERMVTSVGATEVRSDNAVALRVGATHAIRLLTAAGRTEQAATVARRSRVRALRPAGRVALLASLSIEERAAWSKAIGEYERARDELADRLTSAWSMAADRRASVLNEENELRETMRSAYTRAFDVLANVEVEGDPHRGVGEGGLWLVFHPSADGWYGIASTRSSTVVHELDLPSAGASAETLARVLLEPFAAQIDAAESIGILPMGPLLGVPFHELPWRSEPLVAHAPVVWIADFGGAAPAVTEEKRALVVGDPASRLAGVGRLPEARAEAEAVADALDARGFSVSALVGADATVASVLAGFQGARWFHYAGHGLAKSSDPWDFALPLAGEALLTARDILASPRVPHTVVLSGCETAAARSGAALSLATTFVLAGSSIVVGSTSDIADDEAADAASTLYRHAEIEDGAAWFRAAILDGRARGRGWTSELRVWSP